MLAESFRALEARDRRLILLGLHGTESRVEIPVLEELPSDGRTDAALRTELYHTHLPILREREFITWDGLSFHVGRGPQFDAIHPLLDLLDEHGECLPGEWP